MERLGAWLYRHRGLTAAPFAAYLVWAARPTAQSFALGLGLVLLSEALRVNAIRYAGGHTRGLSLRAPRLATGGPYARLRHPLYVGNAGVCAGLIVAAWAGWPTFPFLFAAAFLVQYALFIRREERFLAETFGAEWRAYAARVPAVGWGSAGVPEARPAPVLGVNEALRVEFSTLRTILVLLVLVAMRAKWSWPR